ncbi:MAG TPA: phosphatase PAP2 family protein [Actinomycetota bacterium]|jgi:membrane-associated phospholipid phosphatase|nr:phosphatase PAP2 family protein [Actinomycetota bacterium]
MRRGLRRRVSRCSVGVGLLAGSYAAVRRPGITEAEERVFRWANEADDRLRTPVRAVMQAGTFITVPIVAIVAFLAGRRALAVRVLLAGTAAWLGAKAIKPYGGRDRPFGVLGDGVRLREAIDGDLGWVSGHTAVATTLSLVLADDLPGWTSPILAGIVAMTGYGRMYVGAHLPHDLVGGAGLGLVLTGLAPGGGA